MASRSLTSPGPDSSRTRTDAMFLALQALDRDVVGKILYLPHLFTRTIGFEVVLNPSPSRWAPGFRAMPLSPITLQAVQRKRLEREEDVSAEEELLRSLESDVRILVEGKIKEKDAAFVRLYLRSLLLTVVLFRKLYKVSPVKDWLSSVDVVGSCLAKLREQCPQFQLGEIPLNTDENITRITQLVLHNLYMSPIPTPCRNLEGYLRAGPVKVSPSETFLGQCLLLSESFFDKQLSFLPRETKEQLAQVVSDAFKKMLMNPGTSLEREYEALVSSAEAVLRTKPAPTTRMLAEVVEANLVPVKGAFEDLKEGMGFLCELSGRWLSGEKSPLEDPLLLLLLRSV